MFRSGYGRKANWTVDEVINKLAKYKPFEVGLKGFTLDKEDKLLHLLIAKGKEEIVALHDDLYSGILEKHWRKE